MHEISVAKSLVDLVEEQIASEDGVRVLSLTVAVGPLSGIVPMALQFAFEVATHGTVLQGSRLNLLTTQLVVWCPKCATERVPTEFNRLRCPVCLERTPTILRGGEMELVQLELADGPTDGPAIDTADFRSSPAGVEEE